MRNESMKTYYDNMQKDDNTTLFFQSLKNGDGVQILMASIPDDHAVTD
jgi:hypothetical protein